MGATSVTDVAALALHELRPFSSNCVQETRKGNVPGDSPRTVEKSVRPS